MQTAMAVDVANREAVAKLEAAGVTLHEWSPADRAAFRAGALKAWEGWAEKTPEARELVDKHRAFQKRINLID